MSLPPMLSQTPATDERAPGPRRRGTMGMTAVVVLAVILAIVLAVVVVRLVAPQRRAAAPAPTAAANCLAVGAAVNLDGQPPSAGPTLFQQVDQEIGPLSMRRSFDPVLPPSFAASSAAGDPKAGLRSFVSWKPPNGDHRGAAAGRYDRQITAWANSVPRTGVYATAFHEPENDMKAAAYLAFERHVYTVVKAANPTIRFGPVYMAYWWDPAQPQHYIGNPAAWWPGKEYADFVGLDWYGADPTPMTTSASFLNWYRFAQPTGLPLVIPEYGQYNRPLDQPADKAKERARVRAIRQDAAFILAHPAFRVWLYWEGGDGGSEYRMQDAASQAEWRRVAGSGCRS